MQGKSEASTVEFTLEDPNGATHPIILAPADSPIDLKVYLSEFAPLSHYTNYHFESENTPLQDYVEFSEQSTSNVLKMVLNPYNDRTFKHHIKRIKEILLHPPSSFSNIIPSTKVQPVALDITGEKTMPSFSMDSLLLNPSKSSNLPSYLDPYNLEDTFTEIPNSLLSISYSENNPPSSKRRLQGDLGYITIKTLENNTLCITCAIYGFYVNSTDWTKGLFKPESLPDAISGKTLVELLCKASQGFKVAWDKLITIGKDWNTIRFLPTIIPTPSWVLEKPEENSVNESFSMRDWNEEFQMVRSLPTETPLQRIQRDKAIGKIYSDFLEVAINGTKQVISGGIQPLNPMDPIKQQLFVHNSIFFSFTEDLEYVVLFI